MIKYEATISFSDKETWGTTFWASGWDEAMERVTETVQRNSTNDEKITDIDIRIAEGL